MCRHEGVNIAFPIISLMISKKVIRRTAKQKLQMQGAQVLRSEAYCQYVAITKDAAQRGRWIFYEAVILAPRCSRGATNIHKEAL